MFAVIQTGGKQYRVTPNDKIIVEKLEAESGKKITFDKVLLINNEKETKLGDPEVKGASVEAEVIKNFKNDKVIIFKKRRRKNSRRKKGHRQFQTLLKILKINP